MIIEDTEDDPSLSIMEMMIPMLVILALVGLVTVCRMAVECYR